MADIELTRPKLNYRMKRELIEGLRAYAARQGISVTAVLSLLVQGLLDGEIRVTAEQTRNNEARPRQSPDWMTPPTGEQ